MGSACTESRGQPLPLKAGTEHGATVQERRGRWPCTAQRTELNRLWRTLDRENCDPSHSLRWGPRLCSGNTLCARRGAGWAGTVRVVRGLCRRGASGEGGRGAAEGPRQGGGSCDSELSRGAQVSCQWPVAEETLHRRRGQSCCCNAPPKPQGAPAHTHPQAHLLCLWKQAMPGPTLGVGRDSVNKGETSISDSTEGCSSWARSVHGTLTPETLGRALAFPRPGAGCPADLTEVTRAREASLPSGLGSGGCHCLHTPGQCSSVPAGVLL